MYLLTAITGIAAFGRAKLGISEIVARSEEISTALLTWYGDTRRLLTPYAAKLNARVFYLTWKSCDVAPTSGAGDDDFGHICILPQEWGFV